MPVQRPRRRLGRDLAALLIVGLIFLTLATARRGDERLYPPSNDQAVSVYLVDNGFHTDLAVPRTALAGHLSGRAADMATDQPWVMVGWGDERFFVETGLSLHRVVDGLRALFAPGNPSAIRIDGLARPPDQVFASGVHRLRLSPAGLARLAARVDRSLQADATGAPAPLHAVGEPGGRFFHSVEPFSLVHLCNHWTGDLLDAAGVPTTPVLDTLPGGLRLDLWLRAGVHWTDPAPRA